MLTDQLLPSLTPVDLLDGVAHAELRRGLELRSSALLLRTAVLAAPASVHYNSGLRTDRGEDE